MAIKLVTVKTNLSQAVGGTPLVKLNRLTVDLKATVLVKMESMNPLGSVKDRIGVSMVNDAEEKGLITAGKSTLIEPTSGNTGIALAFVAAARGYKIILVMPETMSIERRKMLAALGAELAVPPRRRAWWLDFLRIPSTIDGSPSWQSITPNL